MEIHINKKGLTVGRLKEIISNCNDDIELKITQHKENELYESKVIELINEKDRKVITLVSELTRDVLEK